MGEQFNQLGEDKPASVSQRKRKIGENKYTSFRNKYDILSSVEIFLKYQYMFCIDTIKVLSRCSIYKIIFS